MTTSPVPPVAAIALTNDELDLAVRALSFYSEELGGSLAAREGLNLDGMDALRVRLLAARFRSRSNAFSGDPNGYGDGYDEDPRWHSAEKL